MKVLRKESMWMLGLALVGLFSGSAQAQTELYSNTELLRRIESIESQIQQDHDHFVGYSSGDGCDSCGSTSWCDCECGCSSSYVFADVELNFMRFNQSDGVGILGASNSFDYEATPRLTLGVVGSSGLGVRVRYWSYNYSAGPFATSTMVDTYNIDLELFDKIHFDRLTSLEWSAGLRYNDFRLEERAAGLFDDFGGVGALFGLKLNRVAGPGDFYGRASWAILADTTSNSLNVATTDNTGMQTELGIGYEMTRCMRNGTQLTARVGYEVQFWSGYGINSAALGNGIVNIGWDGAVFGVELAR